MKERIRLAPDTRWPPAALRAETHFDGRQMLCYHPRAAHLGAMITAATAGRMNHIALIDGEQHLSWQQVHELSARFAAGLHAQGVRGGDRAVLLMGNHAGFVIAQDSDFFSARSNCVLKVAGDPLKIRTIAT